MHAPINFKFIPFRPPEMDVGARKAAIDATGLNNAVSIKNTCFQGKAVKGYRAWTTSSVKDNKFKTICRQVYDAMLLQIFHVLRKRAITGLIEISHSRLQ